MKILTPWFPIGGTTYIIAIKERIVFIVDSSSSVLLIFLSFLNNRFKQDIRDMILCQEKVQIKNDFFPSCQHT